MLTLALAVRPCVRATDPPKQGLADMLLEYMAARYPGTALDGHILYVSAQRQRLFHVVDGRMQGSYLIATAKAGLGCTVDSHCTPPGLHRVAEKIGDGLPLGAVLKDRLPTGEVADLARADSARDVITSRILWLEGLEEGANRGGTVDSHERYIYLHGTGDESSLGRPTSMGCVRMRNVDIVALFDQVPIGALVVILDN
ncbi:MAG: L,D-transpeptidase [Flavobacteriales bacterium]|nr:L,D-transpeptidase [Flavobacteriales bacterium]